MRPPSHRCSSQESKPTRLAWHRRGASRASTRQVRGLLRHYPPRLSSPRKAQVASGISIDRQRQEVLLSQGRVHLVGREFDLLVLLFDRAPKVMTRRVLHEPLHVDDVVLDRVHRLRERLEAVEEWRRIQTVRGVGFRLLDCDPGRPIEREPAQTSQPGRL
jgi:DNA-binding response OmpR family regulator